MEKNLDYILANGWLFRFLILQAAEKQKENPRGRA